MFATTTGPQIVVGSSMGGWLALLMARALRPAGRRPGQGLVLIAPAVDMTAELMLRMSFTKKEHKALEARAMSTSPPNTRPSPIASPVR